MHSPGTWCGLHFIATVMNKAKGGFIEVKKKYVQKFSKELCVRRIKNLKIGPLCPFLHVLVHVS